MLVISSLTVGQITFILRAVIQILSYGGLFLLGFIVYASAPQIASLKTHDVLNRVVGKETASKHTMKWIFNSLRNRNGDPVVAKRLVLSLSLLTVYSLFVALSDLGFLGFYACNVSAGSFYDHPGSVRDSGSAQSVVNTALVNGTKADIVKVTRCDASQTEDKGSFNLQVCTSWHNSTLSDPSVFAGINNTDSDMLLPRLLRHSNHSKAATFDLNLYRTIPLPTLLSGPTIMNGMVAEPHDKGVRTVFGVPDLQPGHTVDLQKNMAMEIEVGCMAVGLFSSHVDGARGNGLDYFAVSDNFNHSYYGPENMRDVLKQTVDEIRDYYSPLFETAVSEGFRMGINESSALFTDIPTIDTVSLPRKNGTLSTTTDQLAMMGNCTERMRKTLGVDKTEYMSSDSDKTGPMCSFLTLNGAEASGDGDYVYLSSKLICASSTQVNMVSGTVGKDRAGQVTLNVTRLPSDLHQLRADYFDMVFNGENTTYNTMQPILRYTLSDNPNGETSHYIYQNKQYMSIPNSGTGSPGNAISRIGSILTDIGSLSIGQWEYVKSLNDQQYVPSQAHKTVTTWAGRFGGSLVLNSLVYNGYVAQQVEPVLVTDIDGKAATCYRTPYAVSFIPLILAAVSVSLWILVLLLSRGLSGTKRLEELYGGLKPYWGIVCPTTAAQSAILSWESQPGPHLALLTPGQPISVNDSTATAVRQLTRAPSPLLPSKASYA
ncbi:hypothetical protein V5O48_001066 [Marasmius crinis-equi]|uniref:Uncharacterized protein n=1 Tax=Marasmius crinis-equi TaxID=585013 RepID=A0ABR3G007_9AGAR